MTGAGSCLLKMSRVTNSNAAVVITPRVPATIPTSAIPVLPMPGNTRIACTGGEHRNMSRRYGEGCSPLLLVDIHEDPRMFAEILQEVPDAQHVSINTQDFPDFHWTGIDGTYGLENKQWSEILGKLDHLEEQLGRQYGMVDHPGLVLRGTYTPLDETHCQTYDKTGEWMTGTRSYFQNPRGLQKFLHRIQQWGIKFYRVADNHELANLVVDLYRDSQIPFEDHKTFNQVIVEKKVVMGDYKREPAKLRLIKQLMGLEAGIGEEMAEAIARWTGEEKIPPTLHSIASNVSGIDMRLSLESVALRSGKRTVGPAAVARLKEALGV